MTTTAILTSTNESWKQLNFNEFQKELTSNADSLASRQDESDVSRKKLIELSRDFKKNTAEEIRRVVAPLLKCFQNEIDSLTKRSKLAETDYLNLYKRLIDLPDPTAALDHALAIQKKLQRYQDIEFENKQLRERIEEYNAEFADVKNQEVTIKQLKEKIRELEERMESTITNQLREKEREITTRYAEKERLLSEKQIDIVRKLGEAEQKALQMQNSLESSQAELLDLRMKYEETVSARSAESEMLLADVERANERSASFEREVESLHQKLRLYAQEGDRGNMTQSDILMKQQQVENRKNQMEMELDLAAKDKEISQLVGELRRLQNQLSQSRGQVTNRITQLEEELVDRTGQIANLEARLKAQADYEEIKRELQVLRSIEFASVNKEEDSTSLQSKSLEQLLLEKNRTMQNELTQTKVLNQQLTSQLAQLTDNYEDAVKSNEEQRSLIAQLEEDLRKVKAFSAMFRGSAEGQDSSPAVTGSKHLTINMDAAPSHSSTEAQFLADVVGEIHPDESLEFGTVQGSKTSESLLTIVQSQRDRFRSRTLELEAQATAQQQQIQLQQSEMDKLRADNVKLYEKIKFLHSYSGKSSSDDVTMNKYSSAYEEALNPFNSFSKKERQKRYQDLQPYEKFMLTMGRFIMGNRTARLVTFFYTVILHLLVFIVLYKMAHMGSDTRDMAAECNRNFQNHMHKFHPHNR